MHVYTHTLTLTHTHTCTHTHTHTHTGGFSIDACLCLFRVAGAKWVESSSDGSKVILVVECVECVCDEMLLQKKVFLMTNMYTRTCVYIKPGAG